MYEPASYGPRTATIATVSAVGQQPPLATDVLCPMYARIQDLAVLGQIIVYGLYLTSTSYIRYDHISLTLTNI